MENDLIGKKVPIRQGELENVLRSLKVGEKIVMKVPDIASKQPEACKEELCTVQQIYPHFIVAKRKCGLLVSRMIKELAMDRRKKRD